MPIVDLTRPASLGALVDSLHRLPRVVLAAPGTDRRIRLVHVELDPITSQLSLWQIHEQARAAGAHALVVIDAGGVALDAQRSLRLPLVSLAPGATHEDVVRLLGKLEADPESWSVLAEERAKERIFTIADRTAELLDGHILVEDEDFHVLAYSQLSDHVDEARQQAILHRQLPAVYQQIFNSQGVQASLLGGTEVIQTEPAPEHGLGPRLIVAIRRYGRLVGTIWFARDHPVFSERDIEGLRSAAQQMSRTLVEALRERRDERIRHDDALLDLLHGRNPAEAAHTLETSAFDLRQPAHVLTVAPLAARNPGSSLESSGLRVLAEVTARAAQVAALTVVEGERLHLVHLGCTGPGAASCDASESLRLATRLLESFTRIDFPVAIGIGAHAEDHSELAASKASAGRVATALLREDCGGARSTRQAWAELTIDTFLGGDSRDPGAIPERLRELLQEATPRAREQVRTIRVTLDHWGDLGAASAALHVHQNTIRYRLQRFQDSCELDLKSPKTRLALWMLLVHAEHRGTAAPGSVDPSASN